MAQAKYSTKNPIATYLVNNFFAALQQMLQSAMRDMETCNTYLEIGCGEGELFRRLEQDIKDNFDTITGLDIDMEALQDAKSSIAWADFHCCSIYDAISCVQSADLLICCEVLEHLQKPMDALDVLAKLCRGYMITSVPREPIWCMLNMFRGKYIRDFGNTPGHLNHWNSRSFRKFLSPRFTIIKELRPLPWIMFLTRPISYSSLDRDPKSKLL